MKKCAFTLSEVLLVLSIIGVVAALTIPTLIQKTNDSQVAPQLKKVYSVLSQAFTSIYTDNAGDVTGVLGGNGSAAADANAMNVFASKLNVVRNCGNSTGCWYNTSQKYLNGTEADSAFDSSNNGSLGKVVLSDGTMLLMNSLNGACVSNQGSGPLQKVCGIVGVDINGSRLPNTIGRDYFEFIVTSTGIYPAGSYDDGRDCSTQGWGCTYKVLTEGKMNY